MMGRNKPNSWVNYNRFPLEAEKFQQNPHKMNMGHADPFKEYYEFGNQQMGKQMPNYNPNYLGRQGSYMDYLAQEQFHNQK